MSRPSKLYWRRWALGIVLLLVAVTLLLLGSGATRIAGTVVGLLALCAIPFSADGKT